MKKYLIQQNPFIVPTTDGKRIEEHFGKVANSQDDISVARMTAPPYWSEPFQTPAFDEYTYIISGRKQFIIDGETVVLGEGESIKISRGARVQYSNPFSEPCHYLSICTPAFSMEHVNREEE